MQLLVTGGAGYIGSHMVKLLQERGHSVLALDNLVAGRPGFTLGAELLEGDVGERTTLDRIFMDMKLDGVIHFAAHIRVDESVAKPNLYYQNNVAKTLVILEAMREHGVQNFIFSSSAAVFGEPQYSPIDERHPTNPINPYGMSKLMVEYMLADMARAYDFKYVSLRYFNAAGADPGGWQGGWHDPPLHLIPMVLYAALGRRESIRIFGHDYDTPDGTCIRDYVHVMDLCEAHFLALDYLKSGGAPRAFNLGNGNGFSVREVIDAARRIIGRPIKTIDAPRRPGDPAALVADSTLASRILGWQPRYPDLDQIISHAWQRLTVQSLL